MFSRSRVLIDPELPLIDLHRHIDGSVRLITIIDLARKHAVKLPGTTVEELRPHVQVVERQPGVWKPLFFRRREKRRC